jgi:hypothetical protein
MSARWQMDNWSVASGSRRRFELLCRREPACGKKALAQAELNAYRDSPRISAYESRSADTECRMMPVNTKNVPTTVRSSISNVGPKTTCPTMK